MVTHGVCGDGDTERVRRGRPDSETDADPSSAPTPSPGRRAVTTRLACAWLALLGAAAVYVGGADTVQGTEINVRVIGTFVLGAGFVLIAGAIGLRAQHAAGRSLAIVAALLGVVLGAMTFMAQAVSDEPDRRLAVWALIIALSAATARFVRAMTPPAERAQSIWSNLPFLKSTVTIGVVVSVGQFWYTSIYIPTTAPASLSLQSRLSKVAETDTRIVLKGVVTIRNTSDTRVNVLGSAVDVRAQTLTNENLGDADMRARVGAADDPQLAGLAERYVGVDKETLITHGRLLDVGVYFDPGEVIAVPVTAWLPKHRYDRASLYATLTIARGKVLAVESEEPKITRTGSRVELLTRVPEAGLLRRLTRSDRYVRTEYYSNTGVWLTYREYQVAQLVKRGLSDRQIGIEIATDLAGENAQYAADLVPQPKTVRRHVASVMTKLGVDSRSEVGGALDGWSTGYRVWFAPDGRPNPPKDFDQRLRRLYGATSTTASDVVALPR